MKKTILIIFFVIIIFIIFSIIWYILEKFKRDKAVAQSLPPAGGSGENISNPLSHTDNNYNTDDANFQNLFLDIQNKYGKNISENVEKIYRLETNHFKSSQYKNTGSAGMLAFGSNLPYGWLSLNDFWKKNKSIAPSGVGYTFGAFKYLAFPNYGGFYALAEILKRRKNNPGSWYSNNLQEQSDYNKKINNIKPQFV